MNLNIIKHLSENIGPRVAGTEKEHRASVYIENEFKAIGLETKIQTFSFLNWILNDPPKLWIQKPQQFEMKSAPMAYTLPTRPQGIIGNLKKIGKKYIIPGYMEWEKYTIMDKEDNNLGYLVVNPNGQAAPIPNNDHLLPEIGAVIGNEDGERIDSWLASGKQVCVCLWNPGTFVPSQSQNVIGVLGKGTPEIVVCAHYDSVFYSPGAVDNGSGVQVMYNIAKRLKKENNSKIAPIAFVAMGCEELALSGSRHYVKYLKERGLLKNIHFCVNFDMVGNGERIVLRVSQGKWEYISDVIEKSGIKAEREIVFDTPKASSDNWPFDVEGINNMQFVSLPFPLYHQAEDTLKKVDISLVKEIEEIGYQVISHIAKERYLKGV